MPALVSLPSVDDHNLYAGGVSESKWSAIDDNILAKIYSWNHPAILYLGYRSANFYTVTDA